VDRLKTRLEVAARALRTFEEGARLEQPSGVERDAAIQRFEYTFEVTWKTLQQYLRDVEKLPAGSPRAVFRAGRDVELLSDAEAELALQMCDDRNLTVHTYDEALARHIYSHLGSYAELLRACLRGIEGRLASSA